MFENKKLITIVVSLYNEEEGLSHFYSLLLKSLLVIKQYRFELIWVNDGSSDGTGVVINKAIAENTPSNIEHTVISFSKNFGHEAAMIAGIDNSTGELIICMDGDGQHPPKNIESILKSFEKGAEIILMKRAAEEDYSLLKKVLTKSFYKIINMLSSHRFESGSTDFFAISKQVAQVLQENYREKTRFIRGFIQNVGFNKEILPFSAPPRLYGESNYNYYSLLKHALNAVFSFSNTPLRLSIIVSLFFVGFTTIFGCYSLYMFLFGKTPPTGYTTIVLFMAFSFSLLFIIITIISVYFEKLIKETRSRPIYIIRKKEKS